AFLPWSLYFLVVGWREHKRWAWALSGVILGVWLYFYTGSRQGPLIMAAVLAWAALTDPAFLSAQWRNVVILGLSFAIAAAPMGAMYLNDADEFNARLTVVGVLQSGWLDRAVGITRA